MNIREESTSRGYQAQLLAYITKTCQQNGGECTDTTGLLARRTGTTRNVTKKALRDLMARGLITRVVAQPNDNGVRRIIQLGS